MASAWSEEETFVCSVCLDTLKEPTTLPCGHSYCLTCIRSHWDKRDTNGQYSCPQCRQVFNPRPSLAKSTVLAEVMEKLRTSSLKQSSSTAASSAPLSMPTYLEVLPGIGPRQGSIYPQLPTVDPRLCSQHNWPLNLFCHEDRECVCEVCCQQGHEGHRVTKTQEERQERQKELVQIQGDVQKKIKETEKKLLEIPHIARQHKALVQAVQQESTDLFSEIVQNMNLTGTQVSELLSTHEASLGSQVEGQIHRLEQEVVQLRWKDEELSRLADMQDHVCFLKNFFTMEPPCQTGPTGESILSQEEEVASIRSAIKELQESVQDLCKASLAKIARIVNQDLVEAPAASGVAAEITSNADQVTAQDTVYDMTTDPPPLPPPRPQSHQDSHKSPHPMSFQASAPPPPPQPQAPPATTVGPLALEPKTRAELLKFRFEPTMDPSTAYRHVQLSDGGRKATMRAENLNPPDHPERFHFWRQVLCREALGGSPYYWEVEWTGQKVTIGVAYKEMERKGSDDKSRLGHNAQSWSLYWSGTGFSFWHNGQEKLLGSPKARRIGVYLDQHAGILSFYRITNNQVDLIHRHQSQFSGPLYPGFRFWAGVGATVTVCELE